MFIRKCNIMENIEPIQENDQGDLMFYIFLVLAVLIGAMIGTGLAAGLGAATGIQLGEITGSLGEDTSLGVRNYIRAANGISHLFTFTVPALVFAAYFYGKRYWSKLGFQSNINSKNVLLGTVFMVSSFPFIQLLYWLNKQLPLPEVLTGMEASAEQMLKAMLTMDSPIELIFNLIIVGILPALGEELIFRGLLQQRINRFLKNGPLAIWITALIFSAIHLQFEGFLPRMFLGAALGYLFYWTKNLWIPIIAHLIFNGMQVVGQYVAAEKMEQLEIAETMDPNWSLALLSLVIMLGMAFYLKKSNPTQQSNV